jgi:hypothetical protein
MPADYAEIAGVTFEQCANSLMRHSSQDETIFRRKDKSILRECLKRLKNIALRV